MPWEFAELSQRQKAFLIASIDVRLKAEKEQEDKMKRSSKRR
ncbi:hypothetical protein [Paenibacillus sp. 1001270B_150601_E10]|nr:hypothetical protein [Paenibacillus sp. 1001270B_150601_E10]